MKRKILLYLAPYLFGSGIVVGCSDPMPPSAAPIVGGETTRQLEDCAASDEWLPATPAVPMFMPLPHPTTECPFYRGGWQNFLLAMQPDAAGMPAILSWPTIDTTFTSRFKHPANRSYLGDVKQAGRREILIDQNGNSLYYGIHMNEAFRQFIADNDLKTSDKLQAYPTTKGYLFFPPGLAEFKSAWQIVEGDAAAVAAQTAGYVSMVTTVPTLSQNAATKDIVEDRDTPRTVTVRLLAIHVVFTLPGHPEFIWASFEHSLGAPDSAAIDGKRDVAPTFEGANPDPMDPTNSMVAGAASDHDFLLYKGGTPVIASNVSKAETELNLDSASQKFVVPGTTMPEATSIYRMFPASKSNTIVPDEAITSLNNNVEHLFALKAAALSPSDKRGNYRLVGAQWMDKPDYFTANFAIQNDLTSPYAQPAGQGVGVGQQTFIDAITTDGSDSPYSILAGEDRMSSTAMESFTQSVGSFENCFRCHDTHAITANGVPLNANKEGIKLLDPGLLNVSHVISQFILEDCNQPANVKVDPSDPSPGTLKAFCPPFPATGPQ
jgi:hypothetical protein